jgi:spore coat assembly protein
MENGMLVTRYKYNHDIVFKIIKIIGESAILQGESVRLRADAPLFDLKIVEIPEKNEESLDLEFNRNSKQINGCVLHLDGDKYYLKKCLDIYKKYNIPVQGYYMNEKDMPNQITNLLVKHNPDILIITGHDNYKVNDNKEEIFENSKYFIQTVKKARVYQADKDALVIFAGACQSYYEALIESGANFASSPTRKNIHVLDPVYIAISVAVAHVGSYINIEETLRKTVSKGDGLGGIDTRGVARRIY